MHDDGYFDESIAADYDDDSEAFAPETVEPTVDFLARLAGSGRALELAVGTGRIALPLAQRGVPVAGIELSRAMAERLAAKPDADRVPVTIGDMADTVVDGTFALVYLVFNTIMNLTSQQAQVRCFRNAAAHLEPGGRFVVEVLVPQPPRGERHRAFLVSEDHWGIDEYDVVDQRLVSHHLRIVGGETRRFSLPCRYVWPAELDLMAQLAGLSLEERWADWQRRPFTGTSTAHVSVWRKGGG